jgi:energy-coupling factor transporter ATP-binding protein EcfA2
VFFGPSGAGKTTIATIAAGMGVPILGEDIVLIRRVGRSYWVHSLPFGSLRKISDAQSRSAPLAGMYRLRKGPKPQILPLPGVRRIAEIVSAIPFIHLNRDMSLAAMTVCENIIAAVPVQETWFRADQSVQAVLPDNVAETVGDRPLSQSFASVI